MANATLNATQWTKPAYIDGDWGIADPVSLPEFSSPIPARTDPDILTQEFTQALEKFQPCPLNTPHSSANKVPDYSEYFLVNEGQLKSVGGGMVKWTRTYARVPDPYDEFESYAYPFIGFQGLTLSGSQWDTLITGRQRQQWVVTSRVRHEFFKVGPGGSYPTAGQIPIVFAQQYVVGDFAGFVGGMPVDYITDAGGIGATNWGASVPSRTQYGAWMAAAKSRGWASDVAVIYNGTGIGGQIVAEDSRLTRWRGNVWLRQVRFLLAQ